MKDVRKRRKWISEPLSSVRQGAFLSVPCITFTQTHTHTHTHTHTQPHTTICINGVKVCELNSDSELSSPAQSHLLDGLKTPLPLLSCSQHLHCIAPPLSSPLSSPSSLYLSTPPLPLIGSPCISFHNASTRIHSHRGDRPTRVQTAAFKSR